ncbi:Uncharacterised protein [uncultured archaeon]|nr:Uncharacterised protein [uncultured archaeon]
MWQEAFQTWYCPFCQQQTIKVHFIPSAKIRKATRGSGQSGSVMTKRNPNLTILTDSCSNCGKTKEEIEPKLLY